MGAATVDLTPKNESSSGFTLQTGSNILTKGMLASPHT